MTFPRSHRLFNSLVVPMWIKCISCLDNMWDISDFADEMQSIWDHAIPNILHTVSRSNNPLMQRAYDYRSDFGERAQVVIQKFIEKGGWTPSDIFYPYMWKECVGDEADPDAYYRAFEDHCILDMFTLYLEYIHKLPTAYYHRAMRKGALSIATVVVERTWKMWSTGTFEKPTNASHQQFAEGLWSHSTKLIMESIDSATRHKWKKILKGAGAFIDVHQKHPTQRAQAQAKGMGVNGQAMCIDEDSHSDSGSDILLMASYLATTTHLSLFQEFIDFLLYMFG
ncbi:uncharacterized protein F5891DRAFT_978217 [Suillus fuscotomentosus]|uniref:Uncharacterized protein n=1 Tax=Suillus fuscotomentosus TaxID=1912939 RepID=A0AAD4HNK4_9AGAM|nr:uncharacterized protein F5891DRAFT_978217 [Suillus fuscotomentosus]KAG1903193.1 hypothetical protein F5891DRAFT_978217 [Suillus fuscotomentosus]